VLALAAPMIGRCLDAARESLDEAAHSSPSVAARQAAQDALNRLEQRRAAIRSSFPTALDQAIGQALDTAGQQPASERDLDTLPSDTALALLDDGELSHFVETARLVQQTLPVVQHALTRLNALMSSALGQPVVQSDCNPMRPEVLCRALRQVLDEQGEPADVRRLWLRHLSKSYAKELDGLYRAASDVLQRADVQQAPYRVKLVETGGTGLVMAAGGAVPALGQTGNYPPGGALAMPGGIPGAFSVALHEPAGQQTPEQDIPDEEVIRRRRAPISKTSEPAGTGMAAPLLAMGQFFNSPQLTMPYGAALQQQFGQTPLPPQPWTSMELNAQAARISQALGINAVRALMGQIVNDPRLLAPMRQMLAALEPVLSRLVLAEPHLFGESEHPALRFIEAIAQRSFQYNNPSSPGFQAFAGSAQQAVQALNGIAEPSGQDFDQRLQALQADWQTQDKAMQQACEQSQRSMEFAQKRQQLADRIAGDLSQRPDLAGVPGAMTDFLFKDWSLVIAQAQLTDTHRALDPGGYLAIVTDLLWSVKRQEILHNFARLFETVPRVIGTLRRGLNMLGKDPPELQALFDTLLRFHEPALKLRRLRSALGQGTTPEKMAALLQLSEEKNLIEPGPLPHLQTAAQPWLGRGERQATGFMDIMESDGNDGGTDPVSLTGLSALASKTALGNIPPSAPEVAKTDQQRTSFTPTPPPGVESQTEAARMQQDASAETAIRARALLTQLRQGDWVDLNLHQTWQRAELTWISDNGSLCMFIDHGGQVYSMARDALEKLLDSGHIRPFDSGPVVDKALKALIANAKRNLTATGHTQKR
jgi:hypothetical protein